MASMTKEFPDGGELRVEYTGSGDGEAVVSADVNEGLDRAAELVFATADGRASETRAVVQEGRREELVCVGGDVFEVSGGGAFAVIKEGYEEV